MRWAADERVSVATFQAGARVTAVCFNRAASHVAFGLGDGTVHIQPVAFVSPRWARARRSPRQHSERAQRLTGGPVIRVDPLVTLTLVADVTPHDFLAAGSAGRVLQISPDGAARELAAFAGVWIDQLVTSAALGLRAVVVGRQVHLLDAAGAPVRVLGPHPSTVAGMALDPAGERLAVSHNGGATVWLLERAAALQLPWKGSHLTIAWSPDRRFVATATQENELHCWRLSDRSDMRMSGYPTKVASLQWTHDSAYLVTGGAETATCWPFDGDGPEGRTPRSIGRYSEALAGWIACHPRRREVAIGYNDGAVTVRSLERQRNGVLLAEAGAKRVTALAWSPCGRRLAAGREDGRSHLWSLPR